MNRKVTITTFFLITCLTAGLAADHKHGKWGYSGDVGPDKWGDTYPMCDGKHQSPIDIDIDNVHKNSKLGAIKFTLYKQKIEKAVLKNNGHTAQMTIEGFTPEISGAGLNGTYKFLQLHFHWGKENDRGSEHTIEGNDYVLEMHLVHRKSQYSLDEALKRPDGLAVLGVFFELDDEDNKEMKPIINTLDDIVKEGAHSKIKETFNLDDLIPDDTLPYYRYFGSLTTPECQEAVVWTIFKHTQQISKAQLEQFRTLKESSDGDSDDELEDNYRPVQPLNERVVYISSDTGDKADDTDEHDDHYEEKDDDDDDEEEKKKKKGGDDAATTLAIPFVMILITAFGSIYNNF